MVACKLDHDALPELEDLRPRIGAGAAAPRTPAAEVVAAILVAAI